MTLPVVILAGGLATRLRPITEKIPKSLVEVAGQPFICRQLRYLESQGVKKVTLCIGYLGEKIESVVGTGSQFGIEVTYSPDGPDLLGTGGAIRKALPLLNDNFFVLYGDSFLPIDFAPVEEAFRNSKHPALMTILKNSNQWDASNVSYFGGKLIEYNKEYPSQEMNYIDYGLGILSRGLFHSYEEGQYFDLSEIYRNLSHQSELEGYLVTQRFYEIGSYEGLKETTQYFLN
ncbi:nucleotidyltransferase family protein [Pseudomonadales bacterium]|nr:nucleotidyltransferase family protein [Pseudomonadales bacterium]